MNILNNKPIQKTPPSLEKLNLMLMNGIDFVPIVKGMIDEFKLPYIIVEDSGSDDPTKQWRVKNKLSQGEQWLEKFITKDPETIQMKKYAQLMAPTPHCVLICGETGTGKELLARSMIHNRVGAIKTANCAGIPFELLESILFGHLKGSFTGADTTRDGLIMAAENGIMFMDEIGTLPLPLQPKLLRVLQEKTITKVGSAKEEPINCKFVFATNRNLKRMVEQELFMKDLYMRISTLELHVKPLNERMCDLVTICESMEGGEEFLKVHKAPLELGAFDISGNVRSLEQHVIRFNVLGSVMMKG